jgi:phosphatidylglycerophosphate synthase
VFMYQTLDAVDGKQARRTHSSSPLGQLFDHGCDAICSTLIGYMMAATLQTGATFTAFLLFALLTIPFYVANWEASVTNVMNFGLLGVTEGQLMLITIFIVTGTFGQDIWRLPVFERELKDLLLALAAFASLYACLCAIGHVWDIHERRGVACRRILQFALLVLLFAVWTYSSAQVPSSLFNTMPRVYMGIFSILFCYQVSRLIISHVTEDPYDLVFRVLYPLPLVALLDVYGDTAFPAYVYWLFCVVVYVHFARGVTSQITAFLGIECFRIRPIMHRNIREVLRQGERIEGMEDKCMIGGSRR